MSYQKVKIKNNLNKFYQKQTGILFKIQKDQK